MTENKTTTAAVEGDFLVVRVPLNQPLKPSGSGKTLVVASTYGNKLLELEVEGKKVTIGLNAYIPNPNRSKAVKTNVPEEEEVVGV